MGAEMVFGLWKSISAVGLDSRTRQCGGGLAFGKTGLLGHILLTFWGDMDGNRQKTGLLAERAGRNEPCECEWEGDGRKHGGGIV